VIADWEVHLDETWTYVALARIEQLLEQANIDKPMLDDILRRYNSKLPTK
jgi:hypothetical protein